MMMYAYSILDSKTGMFSQPWFFNHDQTAFRTVNEAAKDPNSNLYKYPEDFHLYKIGVFDDNTAELAPTPLQAMGSIASLLAANRPQPTVEPNDNRSAVM